MLANRSFQEACFPDGAKMAIVKHILKKPNLDPFDRKSWRPISFITIVSKLLERLAIRRFNCHAPEHNLLPKYLSAYRPYYFTETAVTVVFNEIARAVDTGQVWAMVLFDLSAAFNTVDHEIVMDVLEWCLACDDAVKSWFRSF